MGLVIGSMLLKKKPKIEGGIDMHGKDLKRQIDKLRAEASRTTTVPSSVVFALTNPILDSIERSDPYYGMTDIERAEAEDLDMERYSRV